MPRNDPEERERRRHMGEVEDSRDERLRRAYESAGMNPDHPYGLAGRRDDGPPPQPEGPHRGRGPRGYKRSDARIEEDVNDRLTEDRHVDATEIQVHVAGGEVTLAGVVDGRAARRRAEDIAESVSGVTYVMNNLRVRQPGTAGGVG